MDPKCSPKASRQIKVQASLVQTVFPKAISALGTRELCVTCRATHTAPQPEQFRDNVPKRRDAILRKANCFNSIEASSGHPPN